MTTNSQDGLMPSPPRISFYPPDLPDADPDDSAPASPPPAVDADTLHLVALQAALNELSPDGIREYVASNPSYVDELTDGLYQTKGSGFLDLLKKLRDLDVLQPDVAAWVNGYDLATSAAQPDNPGDWTPPARIMSKAKPLPDLPLPDALRYYVQAVAELSGSSLGTAHSAVVGAVNLALTNSIDVESLAADVHPAALFMLTSARTGWRKSAAFNLAWRAHTEADNAIHARWMDARKTKGDKPKGEGGPTPLIADSDTRPVSPIATRDDSTAEALLANLSEGRRTQSLASAEAGVVLGGWSFGKGQSGQTFAKLNGLWSGEGVNYERVTGRVSIRVSDARLCTCLLMQPSFAEQHILSEAALNGFSARSLVNRDIARPKQLTFQWPADTTARHYVDHLHRLITHLRRQQDVGTEFADTPPLPVTVMRPTPEAREVLRTFLAQCQEAADDGDTDGHELGFLERATEQVARYAAMLAAFRCLAAGEAWGEHYTEKDAKDATAVIDWHRLNLASFSVEADDARLAKAAQWAATRLHGWAAKSKSPQGTIQLLSLLGSYCAGDAKFAKDDPDAKRRIMGLLEEYQYVRPAARGAYMVNPLTPDTGD